MVDQSNMNRTLINLPDHLETERLVLRCYQAGDGPWYYAMSQKNREHLMRYESGNPAVTIYSEEDAEKLVRELGAAWAARDVFFLGGFDKASGEFVVQMYIGPANRDLPEFDLGYFVDKDHEGQGYVTEAARASLQFIFEHLKAYRVRLECDDTNQRSYRVAERCGLIKEGHFRQNKRNPDGTSSGTLVYGLLRSEYEALAEGQTHPDIKARGLETA